GVRSNLRIVAFADEPSHFVEAIVDGLAAKGLEGAGCTKKPQSVRILDSLGQRILEIREGGCPVAGSESGLATEGVQLPDPAVAEAAAKGEAGSGGFQGRSWVPCRLELRTVVVGPQDGLPERMRLGE